MFIFVTFSQLLDGKYRTEDNFSLFTVVNLNHPSPYVEDLESIVVNTKKEGKKKVGMKKV